MMTKRVRVGRSAAAVIFCGVMGVLLGSMAASWRV